jgi:hypothetical protein
MNWRRSLAGLLVLSGVGAGCATSDTYSPSASPTGDPYYRSAWPSTVGPAARTDAPQIDNADAAGVASVPGTHTGVAPTVISPPPPAASPVILVPPPTQSPAIVVPPAQPR